MTDTLELLLEIATSLAYFYLSFRIYLRMMHEAGLATTNRKMFCSIIEYLGMFMILTFASHTLGEKPLLALIPIALWLAHRCIKRMPDTAFQKV